MGPGSEDELDAISKHPNMDGCNARCRIGILLELVAPRALGDVFTSIRYMDAVLTMGINP